MDESPEVIRRQIELTKLQLIQNLGSLELQVAETVQSTFTKMNNSVESVHETVETVTAAVHEAVQSVTNAFDVRRQIERHPWLVIGGSAVIGCLAVKYLSGSEKKAELASGMTRTPSCPSAGDASPEKGTPAIASAVTASTIAAAYESGMKSSSWNQLRSAGISTLMWIMQDIASRAVPQIIAHFTGNQSDDRGSRSKDNGNDPGYPRKHEASEAA
ncbi:MAG: hypothetical protein ACKVT0_13100 [Planctomycetaceae bacterium]